MTDDEQARMDAYIREHCGLGNYGEQDENGVDLSLIRENLKRSPLERLQRAERAATEIVYLRKHVRFT